MTKRLLALLMITLIIFCGCNGNLESGLTESEYSEAMEEAYQLYYVKGGWGIVKILNEKIADPSSLNPDIENIFTGIEQAFVIIESISPPKKFNEAHSKLLSKIEYERKIAALEKKALESTTREELNENLDLAYRDDFEFSETILELHLMLNDLYNPAPDLE